MNARDAARIVAPLALLLAAATWAASASRAPTIGDLQQRRVEVRPAAPAAGSAARAMHSYRQFLELQNTDPKLRAEALRRLGDLNLESGELERLSAEVTQLDLQGAEAIRLYTTLLKAYPDYARNDQVLYQLARAYETTGQSATALATLDSIVQHHPHGRDIGEVQFRRGELLFSARRYPQAQAAYQAVIERGPGGSGFYEQSLYKQGWSQFKQAQNEESLDSFMRLLDRKLVDAQHPGTARDWDALSRPDRELAEDTLRVMSIAFSYMDGAASVDRLLAGRPAVPYAWLLYSRLGDLFVEKQRYQDAATTYRAFVARDPVDEHAPSLSNQAIEAYQKGGFTELVVVGKTEYVTAYGFTAPFWSGRQRASSPQVVGELKRNLKDLAQHHHALAQKSKQPGDYGVAARWYGDYLRSFPDDADSADTNYMLAEVLFESRQYASAATEYERSAYAYSLGPRSSAAGYAALVAYQKQEETLPAAQRAAWHAQSVESGLRFAATFPLHPESAGVHTRAAQDLFAAGNLPRAIEVSQQLLTRVPPVDSAKRRIGWTIIGQSQFDLGVFDRSEAAFTRALAVTGPAQPEHADLNERLAAAVYRQGEARRNAGDQAAAAEDFLRVAQLAPGSRVVPTAQYDAAAALLSTRQWDRAITVLEGYRRDWPRSEYSAEVGRKLAVAYVEAGRSAQAASEFERIAGVAGEDPMVVREALGRAADLHATAGNPARSIAMLETLVQKYPVPVAEAIETRARLADLAGKAGNAERQRHWQSEIVKADAAAGAARTDRTRFLAANARLALVTPSRDAFRAVRLTAPLKNTLAAKRRALDSALQGYQAVAAYNVAATTTTATYEMAELYRTLARDLLASDRPKNLSADEREQYDALLEEQAFPLEEEAIAIHELNIRRIADSVYDESVRNSFKALAELKPARYGKSELPVAGLPHDEAALRSLLEVEPANAAAWTQLGVLLREQGRFSEARDAYQQALAADAGSAAAHRNYGVLLDLYLDQPAEALAEFEKYRELSGETQPVGNWVAELRQRTGIKAPAVPASSAPPSAATEGAS